MEEEAPVKRWRIKWMNGNKVSYSVVIAMDIEEALSVLYKDEGACCLLAITEIES